MPDDPIATVFNGRYRVERLLARGGMAEVYVGTDLVLDRQVALKVLARELSRNESFVTRFRREARAAASLSHPNIVSVFDWGEEDGSYFIVMELVEGVTLAQLLTAEGPLPAGRTAAIGADIAAALAAAHTSGVVHRDVKPGNVLIDGEGRVKVTDFGIAQAAWAAADTRLTQTGTVLGTSTYLSPEQAEGRPADARSDIYALGVVLYEMAVGRPPFSGDNPVAIAYQHAHQLPEPPSRMNPAVPAWLEAVIMRALAKDPGQRYQHAEELRSDLLGQRAALPETTVLPAQGTEVLRRFEPAPRRRKNWLPLVAVTALIAAAAGVGAYFGLSGHHTSSSTTVTSRPAPTTTSSTTIAPTTTATTLPTSFAGYQIAAGSGSAALYCPAGIALGQAGKAGPSGKGPGGPGPGGQGGTPGPGGQGGEAGCGSNGGAGGNGGDGAQGAAGGAGGTGGNGGCPPSTLQQMRSGALPCNGTGSDGGPGGSGGKAAPLADGGAGGAGGHGGDTTNAKGGNGGNGGDAKPGMPGGAGGPGQPGGGPSGTAMGVNGANGTNG